MPNPNNIIDPKPDQSLFGAKNERTSSNLAASQPSFFRSGSLPVGAKSFSLAEYKAKMASKATQ